MEDTRLIRIYSKEKVECISYLYNIDATYTSIKKKLNKALSNALFAEKVLLIEGPSERILFEKVMSEISPDFELNGSFILEVGGTAFQHYVDALKNLDIKTIVKTDNDLRAKKGKKNVYEIFGMNRCLKLINQEQLDAIEIEIPENIKKRDKTEILNSKKSEIYDELSEWISIFKMNHIYLSEVDLEHDLNNAIGERMKEIFDLPNPVSYLQEKKLFNMVELVESLTKQDCEAIYNHEQFVCLKELG